MSKIGDTIYWSDTARFPRYQKDIKFSWTGRSPLAAFDFNNMVLVIKGEPATIILETKELDASASPWKIKVIKTQSGELVMVHTGHDIMVYRMKPPKMKASK
jgi:hypothetical protein